MNAQTLGPISVRLNQGIPGWEDAVCTLHGPSGYVAEVDDGNTPAEAKANARLLVASFNAFDKAGRDLGIDAATLAESIDLAALIRAARDALTYLDQLPDAPQGSLAEVAQCGVRYQLRMALR